MKLNEYQEHVLRTANPKADALKMGVMGLVGEAGELIDLVKKTIFHDKPMDTDKLTKEVGDCLFYAALTCAGLGMKFASCLDPEMLGWSAAEAPMAECVGGVYDFESIYASGTVDPWLASIYLGRSVGAISSNALNWRTSEANVTLFLRAVRSYIMDVCIIAHRYGTTLDAAAIGNVEKLKLRYPNGFSSAASVAKADETK